MTRSSRRRFLGSLVAGGLSTWLTPSAYAAVRADPGLILGRGPEGWCDDHKNGGPIVRWNGTEKQWWMWYYARRADFPEDVAPAFGTGSIALAKSSDGVRWERYRGAMEGGAIMMPSERQEAFDSQHIGTGEIVRHDGQWLMAYFGGDATVPKKLGDYDVPEGYQFKGYRCRPGFARSKDGITWERIEGKATGGAAVDIGDNIYGAFPNVFHDGRRFVLMYTALSPAMYHWETQVATSENLVDWTLEGPLRWAQELLPWMLGGLVTRHVMPNPVPNQVAGRWMMVYAALDSRFPLYTRNVGLAVSDDGMSWRHAVSEPALTPAAINRWDGGGVSYPQLVPTKDELRLYYYGFAARGNPFEPSRGIGLATSSAGSLDGFRRVES